jgi:hypothetical protein
MTAEGDAMVALEKTMILWNSADEHPEYLSIHRDRHLVENPVRIKAVSQQDSLAITSFDYLSNSVGSCFLGWQTCKDTARSAYIMGLFNRIVTEDGLSSEEVHKAFMEIDEYAEFHDPNASEDARYDNPFWKLHWDWSVEPVMEAA